MVKIILLLLICLLCSGVYCRPPARPAETEVKPSAPPAGAPAGETSPPGFDLVAAGDVMLDCLTAARVRDYDVHYPFACIAPVLSRGDLVFANLECPLSDRGSPVQKTYTFCACPAAVEALALSGINAVSLANNHILDYGPEALLDTLALLDAQGIAYAGAGPDAELARRPALLEINGIKVALLAYSGAFGETYPAWRPAPVKPGPAFYEDRDAFARDIERASRAADVVIVSMHWGDEYTYTVNREQREMGQLAVDSGANLVLGHHPHTPQGIEIYRGKPVVYSLGNFLFYPFETYTFCNESYIFTARVGQNGVESIRLLPVLLGDSRPCLAAGGEAERLLALIPGLLDQCGTRYEIDGGGINLPLDSK